MRHIVFLLILSIVKIVPTQPGAVNKLTEDRAHFWYYT